MPEPARESPEPSAAEAHASPASPTPAAAQGAAPPARLLALQRAIGNRAVGRLLAREPLPGYEFSDDPLSEGGFGPGDATIRVKPGPVRTTFIRPRDGSPPDMNAYLAEAKARSPTARRQIERAARNGYTFGFVSTQQGAETSEAANGVAINPTGLSHDEILVRILYESGNLANLDLFADVKRRRQAGEFKTGEEYARAKLGAESTTMVYASLKALEAGLTYIPDIDAMVKAATKPDPGEPGGLTWRDAQQRDKVFAAVAARAWQTARLQDPQTGQWVPAREYYRTH